MKSRTLTCITAALTLALSPTIFAFAGVTLLQLSGDPFTNSTSQHRTEVEPDTFAFGSTVVSAFQVGRFFDGGASDIGFATSTNGGKSFTSGFLPGATPFSTPAGIYARVSDASVAYDAKGGVWLISFLGLFPNGNTREVDVLVSRSTDWGLTWSNPVVVNADGDSKDKNCTVCDNTASSPFYGNCYTEFDDSKLVDQIEMSTSTDGGQTWGTAQPTADHAHGIGGQPLVQPNGTVIVPIVASRVGSFSSCPSSPPMGARAGANRLKSLRWPSMLQPGAFALLSRSPLLKLTRRAKSMSSGRTVVLNPGVRPVTSS